MRDSGRVARPSLPFLIVLGLFFVSGFAGLLYEVAWTRQLGLVFGTAELAVATVLAAYFAGLGLGAAVAGPRVRGVRRPLLAYGLLELGVALSALLVPAVLRLARGLLILTFGGRDALPGAGGLATALFYLAASFVILMVPTGLMGATLPLLARYGVRRDDEVGSRVGALYAANTAGAVAGSVAAGFFLLPTLGLTRTVMVAVAANGLVFLGVLILARARPLDLPEPVPTTGPARILSWVCRARSSSAPRSPSPSACWPAGATSPGSRRRSSSRPWLSTAGCSRPNTSGSRSSGSGPTRTGDRRALLHPVAPQPALAAPPSVQEAGPNPLRPPRWNPRLLQTQGPLRRGQAINGNLRALIRRGRGYQDHEYLVLEVQRSTAQRRLARGA